MPPSTVLGVRASPSGSLPAQPATDERGPAPWTGGAGPRCGGLAYLTATFSVTAFEALSVVAAETALKVYVFVKLYVCL